VYTSPSRHSGKKEEKRKGDKKKEKGGKCTLLLADILTSECPSLVIFI
jgi:hypothetical protein